MKKRAFYVALGIPRDADPEAIQVAYRKVITRYRRLIEAEDMFDEPTQPLLGFGVMRTYSERRHSTIFDEPERLGMGVGAEVDRFFGGFVPEVVSPPKARRAGKDLFVELRLDGKEARAGGLFPVHIPVVRTCPKCTGWEEREQLACSLCQGTCRVTEDRVVEVSVPPGVAHGQIARIAMEDVGLHDTDLIVHVLLGTAAR